MAEQLALYRSGFAVSPLAVRRKSRRLLVELASRSERLVFSAGRYVADVALLDELRSRYREGVRKCKRAARGEGAKLRGKAAAVFAATPEGRRAHRLIGEVSERIQGEENALCG